jgi:hypothetical protein
MGRIIQGLCVLFVLKCTIGDTGCKVGVNLNTTIRRTVGLSDCWDTVNGADEGTDRAH